MVNTFDFIGELNFSRNGAVKEQEFASGWTKVALQASIKESQNNSQFIDLTGGYHKAKENKVYSFTKGLFGEKGTSLVIDWNERFDQDMINQVADFKKIVVDLTTDEEEKEVYYKLRNEIRNLETKKDPSDEEIAKLQELYTQVVEAVPNRKEFLTELDAVHHLAKQAEELKGKKFRVRGVIEMSYWNGKFYTAFKAQTFELVSDEFKNKLEGQVDLFFTKGCLDKTEAKSERKYYMDTYVKQYSREHEKDVFYPLATVFNFANHNDENPKHQLHIQMIEEEFSPKGKGVYMMPFVLKFVNGAEVKEVETTDLTPKQKMMVEMGMATPKDFVKQAFGERVVENRVHFPIYKEVGGVDYSNGAIETAFEADELVYVPIERNVPQKEESKVEEKPKKVFDFDEDDLPF